MARRLLQALTGVGDIYSGDRMLRHTPYRLSVWARHDLPGEDDDRHAIGEIDGHIEIAGMGEAVVLAGAESLVLKLEDGRRMPFAILDTGGRIVGRNGFEPA
jgi:hypothetical protein